MSLFSSIRKTTIRSCIPQLARRSHQTQLADFCMPRKDVRPSPSFANLYPDAVESECALLEEASRILTTCDEVVPFLHIVDGRIGDHMQSGGTTLVESMETVLSEMENDCNVFSGVFTIQDLYPSSDFMGLVRERVAIRDAGVSPLHGLQTHRLQSLLLASVFGAEDFERLYVTMGSKKRTNCRRDIVCAETYAPWDDLMDRLSYNMLSNRKRQAAMKNLFDEDLIPVPPELFPSLDARNPEWLNRVIMCAPDGTIDNLRGATRQDFMNRLEEVHEDVFIAFSFGSNREVDLEDNEILTKLTRAYFNE